MFLFIYFLLYSFVLPQFLLQSNVGSLTAPRRNLSSLGKASSLMCSCTKFNKSTTLASLSSSSFLSGSLQLKSSNSNHLVQRKTRGFVSSIRAAAEVSPPLLMTVEQSMSILRLSLFYIDSKGDFRYEFILFYVLRLQLHYN